MKVKIKDKEKILESVNQLIAQIEEYRSKKLLETKKYYDKKRSSFLGSFFVNEIQEENETFLVSCYAADQYDSLNTLKKALLSNLVEEVWLDKKQIEWLL